MTHQSVAIKQDIDEYLEKQEKKGLLRFITCGSVDDGKSTLIGRLLWDSKVVLEDQLAALTADSKKVGTQGEKIDYALLLDGLQAEREQGITIDVAYRYFCTDKRKFIVADTPGHEQYTRNMVTGASTAQAAVILVDARKGVLTQTRRHSYIASLVGIRHVVVAINKMDLVDYRLDRFDAIRREYLDFASELGFEEITAIPLSALEGDNIVCPSDHASWYDGPTLMEYLETVEIETCAAARPFRLPVQWVNRPNLDFRGFCGTIASGAVKPGDEVLVTSSGKRSRVERIVTMAGDQAQAVAGQAVTLTFEDEIDISRGDLLALPGDPPQFSDQFEARLVWLHEQPLVAGRSYLLKSSADSVSAHVRKICFKVDINSLRQEAGRDLSLNEIGVCHITTGKKFAFDSYEENRTTGGFILIDRLTHATVAAGMILGLPADDSGAPRQAVFLDKAARAAIKGQQPKIIWFRGFSMHGRDNIPQLLEEKLHLQGRHTYLLDGAALGKHLHKNIPDAETGYQELVPRLIETADILADAGLIVLVSADADPRQSSKDVGIMEDDAWAEIRHSGEEVILANRIIVSSENRMNPEKLIENLMENVFA